MRSLLNDVSLSELQELRAEGLIPALLFGGGTVGMLMFGVLWMEGSCEFGNV